MKRYTKLKKTKRILKGATLCFCMDGLPNNLVPEIKVRYNRGKRFLGKVSHSSNVATFMFKMYGRATIQLQEQFIVLFLNNQLEIIGYYKHSIGVIDEVLVDIRIIFATALASLSTGIILAHNHPSGSVEPSEQDKKITKQIVEAGKILKIRVVDHIILTKNSYFSFRDADLL